jgi:hypothetical protein
MYIYTYTCIHAHTHTHTHRLLLCCKPRQVCVSPLRQSPQVCQLYTQNGSLLTDSRSILPSLCLSAPSEQSCKRELLSCVKRDLVQCQKRPSTLLKENYYNMSKETRYSVKRDLVQCQKRPSTGVKETYSRVSPLRQSPLLTLY